MSTKELIINNDGIFKFLEKTDIGEGYSEGLWKTIDHDYVLTSLGKYKNIDKEYTDRKWNIYLDKILLRLEGDTLYQLDPRGLKTEIKFVAN